VGRDQAAELDAEAGPEAELDCDQADRVSLPELELVLVTLAGALLVVPSQADHVAGSVEAGAELELVAPPQTDHVAGSVEEA